MAGGGEHEEELYRNIFLSDPPTPPPLSISAPAYTSSSSSLAGAMSPVCVRMGAVVCVGVCVWSAQEQEEAGHMTLCFSSLTQQVGDLT